MDRRQFLRTGAASGVAAAVGVGTGSAVAWASPGAPGGFAGGPATAAPGGRYPQGVASGFDSPTTAVIWTRVQPPVGGGDVSVQWAVAEDAGFDAIVASGSTVATGGADHTVKVRVDGLAPGRAYAYQFFAVGAYSPVGRARTLPPAGSAPDRLRLAFGSCHNYGTGLYPAHRAIAAEDLDGFVFLGDYIYESSGIAEDLGSVGDLFVPAPRADTTRRATDLTTYRAKYKLYRSDPDLQANHANHPLLPVWDDHEFRNNYDRESIAADSERVAAAYQAWFEYMPVMPVDGGTRIHRSVRWGNLAELFLLDTRQYRDRHAGGILNLIFVDSPLQAEGRTMLGDAQRQWLFDGLSAAESEGVRFKLLGNQVMMAPLRLIDLDNDPLRGIFPTLARNAGLYLTDDPWDGYQWERRAVLEHIRDAAIGNVSLLTGDIHMFWTAGLQPDYDDPGSPVVANEFVGGALTSTGLDVVGDLADALGQGARNLSPGFAYTDLRRKGYGVIDIDGATGTQTVEYRTVDALRFDSEPVTTARFTTREGSVDMTVEEF